MLVDQIKEANPIVMTVANLVTPQGVADGINAIGASPIMPQAPEEAFDMVKIARAVAINIGSINASQQTQIVAVLEAARALGRPTVLDPVACGASHYRQAIASTLIQDFGFTVIRGNASEIATLAGIDWTSHGIDAGTSDADPVAVAKQAAQTLDTVIVMSGPTDVITDGQRIAKVPYGTPNFKLHVGSGDLLSSLIGAWLAVSDDPYQAAREATTVFTLAGQAAAEVATVGDWFNQLLTNLVNASGNQVADWQQQFDGGNNND